MEIFESKRIEKENVRDLAAQEKNRPITRENRTGIPTYLKERMEKSTGLPLDDVQVHYNSSLPAKLDALAYTQGNHVEIGPGQERHLPHELGHVIQQKLGLVRANAMHSSGVPLNTNTGLERQADAIGAGRGNAIIQRRGMAGEIGGLNSSFGGRDRTPVQMKDTPEYLPQFGSQETFTRHHIIPQSTMASFISYLIEDAQTPSQATEILADLLQRVLQQYENTWNGVESTEENDTYHKKFIESKDVIQHLLKVYEGNKNKRKFAQQCLQQKDTIVEMFQWLPGNLVAGIVTNNRKYDPGDTLDLEAFDIREELGGGKHDHTPIESLYKKMNQYNMIHSSTVSGEKKVVIAKLQKILNKLVGLLPVITHFDKPLTRSSDEIWDNIYANPEIRERVTADEIKRKEKEERRKQEPKKKQSDIQYHKEKSKDEASEDSTPLSSTDISDMFES